MKKVLCIVATICLLLSLSVPAFAANEENVKKYSEYTALGDSITSFDHWNGMNFNFDPKPGTYPVLLSELMGAKLHTYAYPGFTTRELRYMIDTSYELDDMAFFAIRSNFSDVSGDAEMINASVLDAMRKEVIQSIKSSDLITLNIGANDVFSTSIEQAFDYIEEFEAVDTSCEYADKLVNTSVALSTLPAYVAKVMEENYATFYENFNAILRLIRQLNPNAELLLIGVYNPVGGVPLSDELQVALGDVLYLFSERLNQTINAFAKSYGCRYVDINGTATVFTEKNQTLTTEGFLDNIKIDIHPTLTGHRYIYSRILKALPEVHSCTVSLNIGNMKYVDTVYLDGVAYPCTVKNGVATVHCDSNSFKTAAVYGREKSGLIYLFSQKVYSLRFDGDVCTPSYLIPHKNAATYAAVNALVAANYGLSVIRGK